MLNLNHENKNKYLAEEVYAPPCGSLLLRLLTTPDEIALR